MRTLFLLAIAVLALPLTVRAQTAEDVFEEVDRRQRAVQSQRAEVQMDLIDDRGRTRSRSMLLLTKVGSDDRTKSLLVFTAPADIRGTGLLTVENASGDEQKLYLPALRRVQRISASGRSERFAGSEFAFEDLGTRDPDDYTSRMVSVVDDAFVIEVVPKSDDVSIYDRIVLGIDKERYTIRRADYYEGSTVVKRLRASEFEEVIPGAWQARRLVMEDLESGRRTVLTFTARDSGRPIQDGVFTDRQLQRGATGL